METKLYDTVISFNMYSLHVIYQLRMAEDINCPIISEM